MPIDRRLIAAAAMGALLALPAAAGASGPPSTPGQNHRPATTPVTSGASTVDHVTGTADRGTDSHPTAEDPTATPGPKASASAKARAYGRLCRHESRKHVAGQKGTPFSRCVTAMARAASGQTTSVRAACSSLSHRHDKGTKGTPFSRCVTAAAKLLRQGQTDAGADRSTDRQTS